MDEDDPPSEYAGIAAQFGEAEPLKRREDASEHQEKVESPKKINKRKELQFKASHGLLLVFFTWLLWVSCH